MLLIRTYNRNTKELDIKVKYVDDERSNNDNLRKHICVFTTNYILTFI